MLTSIWLIRACFLPRTTVCFTPGENCTNQIINSVNHTFTSKPIAESLIRAKERGVDVKVITDESQVKSKHSVINELSEQKIHVWIDFKPAIAHSKVIIIDDQKVITGSFNFSDAAQQRNAENLLIITGDSPLVEQYIENWKYRQLQSKPYTPQSQ